MGHPGGISGTTFLKGKRPEMLQSSGCKRNVDGGPPKQLTNFTSDQIFGFDISRDGKQLALARGTQASDVVLISDFK